MRLNKQSNLIKKIMSNNLETICYSIVFLSDLMKQENVKDGNVINYEPKDLIFDEIGSGLLKLLFKSCGIEEVEIEKKENFGIKEFDCNNGFKFTYESPHKLTIYYTKTKGNIDDPDKFIKKLANELIVTLGKKRKVYKIGVNYEIFFSTENPENRITNELLNQYIKNDDLENGYIKLSYKVDQLTKMYLVVTTAKHNDQEGVYFKVNFDNEKKETRKISDILSDKNDLLQNSVEKIQKLLNLENAR